MGSGDHLLIESREVLDCISSLSSKLFDEFINDEFINDEFINDEYGEYGECEESCEGFSRDAVW